MKLSTDYSTARAAFVAAATAAGARQSSFPHPLRGPADEPLSVDVAELGPADADDLRRLRLFAGCGIVADSDPGREWAESRMKLRPMLGALGLDADDVEAIP